MILENKLSSPQRPTLLLDAGHAGYTPRKHYEERWDLSIRYLTGEEDNTDPEFEKYVRLAITSPNNWLGEDELEAPWTTLMLIGGDWPGLLAAFRDLAASLMPSLDPMGHTPSGDDDYYDYYPSGMRLLREFALDLQELLERGRVEYVTLYRKPGPLGVYFAVVADYLRREAARWEPNYITCANVGYNYFFQDEEVEHYVAQLCEHHGWPNNPSGWRALSQQLALPEQAQVFWATPTPERVAFMRTREPKWEPKYTIAQPYKEEQHA